jgi:hypothetical protein
VVTLNAGTSGRKGLERDTMRKSLTYRMVAVHVAGFRWMYFALWNWESEVLRMGLQPDDIQIWDV